MKESRTPLFIGDFYQGAYGPTILLKAHSDDAASWLHNVFVNLANGATQSIDLAKCPTVVIPALEALMLRCVDKRPEVALQQTDTSSEGRHFVWAQDASSWNLAAGLLEPFVAGSNGHQYFTNETKDDALIEISFGEPDVGATLVNLLD
jgi:hypothetical protein